MRLTSGQIRETVAAEHCAIFFDELRAHLPSDGGMPTGIIAMAANTMLGSHFRAGKCAGAHAAFGDAAMILREHCGGTGIEPLDTRENLSDPSVTMSECKGGR